jgi:peptidoglycan/LPS O-acetylase OafA/YrhL
MSPQASGRRVEFDYLRACVVVIVLWHHAILAYHPFAYLNPVDPTATFSPVVDSQRWGGFELIASFNDTFFMSLMFFISGLFVWKSLTRKGAGKYLRDRLTRLGVPFVLGLPLLIPLAYYPAQLEVNLVFLGDSGFTDLWLGMLRSGFHSPGPLWFLWLLLAFDLLVVAYYRVEAPLPRVLSGRATAAVENPMVLFGTLLGVSTLVSLPVALHLGPLEWIGIGPFVAQASRIPVYLVYFLVGTAVGAYGFDRGVLRIDGPLAKNWWAWVAAGLISFVISVGLVRTATVPPLLNWLAYTAPCAALSIGSVAIFLRFAKRRLRPLDSLAGNSYGIYVVHYTFVTWLQYWFLGTDLSAGAKATFVFGGTLILSWGLIAIVRRMPAVARII